MEGFTVGSIVSLQVSDYIRLFVFKYARDNLVHIDIFLQDRNIVRALAHSAFSTLNNPLRLPLCRT